MPGVPLDAFSSAKKALKSIFRKKGRNDEYQQPTGSQSQSTPPTLPPISSTTQDAYSPGQQPPAPSSTSGGGYTAPVNQAADSKAAQAPAPGPTPPPQAAYAEPTPQTNQETGQVKPNTTTPLYTDTTPNVTLTPASPDENPANVNNQLGAASTDAPTTTTSPDVAKTDGAQEATTERDIAGEGTTASGPTKAAGEHVTGGGGGGGEGETKATDPTPADAAAPEHRPGSPEIQLTATSGPLEDQPVFT